MEKILGYEMTVGPDKGTYVSADQAFQYALERMKHENEKTKKEFLDWYYSGEGWEGVKEGMLMIVRYSKPIRFPSGNCSNIQCISGEPEEIREKAEKIAEENGAKVVQIA